MKSKTRNMIEIAFRDIPDIYSGFSLMRDVIYDAALDGERRHRIGRYAVPGFSASLAAKYFTVKWLAEYTLKPASRPSLAEIHRIRHECVLAASFAAAHEAELRTWAAEIPAEFWALDYAEMMEDESHA